MESRRLPKHQSMRGLLAPHTPPGHTTSLRSESPTWLSNEHSVCIYLEFNPKDSILDIKPFIVKTSIHTQNRIIYSEHPYAHKSIGIWPLSVLDVFFNSTKHSHWCCWVNDSQGVVSEKAEDDHCLKSGMSVCCTNLSREG